MYSAPPNTSVPLPSPSMYGPLASLKGPSFFIGGPPPSAMPVPRPPPILPFGIPPPPWRPRGMPCPPPNVAVPPPALPTSSLGIRDPKLAQVGKPGLELASMYRNMPPPTQRHLSPFPRAPLDPRFRHLFPPPPIAPPAALGIGPPASRFMIPPPPVPRKPLPMSNPPPMTLLMQYRGGLRKDLKIYDIKDCLFEFACDKEGSIFLQNQLILNRVPDDRKLVFRGLYSRMPALLEDRFGNYVVQKLFELGDPFQRQTLVLNHLRGRVLALSLHSVSSHVVAKALHFVDADLQILILRELHDCAPVLIKHLYGNRIILAIVESIRPEHSALVQFVVDGFKGRMLEFSSDLFGSQVVKVVLSRCSREQTAPLVAEMESQLEAMMLDKHATYVVQHVLEACGTPEQKSFIVSYVRDNLLELSTKHFASYVVVKSVQFATPEERVALIKEVCRVRKTRGKSKKKDGIKSYRTKHIYPVSMLLRDPHGHWVIQKMLEVADPVMLTRLCTRIRHRVAEIQKTLQNHFGRFVLNKLLSMGIVLEPAIPQKRQMKKKEKNGVEPVDPLKDEKEGLEEKKGDEEGNREGMEQVKNEETETKEVPEKVMGKAAKIPGKVLPSLLRSKLYIMRHKARNLRGADMWKRRRQQKSGVDSVAEGDEGVENEEMEVKGEPTEKVRKKPARKLWPSLQRANYLSLKRKARNLKKVNMWKRKRAREENDGQKDAQETSEVARIKDV